MQKKDAYLVVDIGTGNVRVVVVNPYGEILGVATGDIVYHRDNLYPDSIYFDPELLWQQLKELGARALKQAGDVLIKAITTTSQREGSYQILTIGVGNGNILLGTKIGFISSRVDIPLHYSPHLN